MSKRSVIWSLFQNHSLIWWPTLPFKNFSSSVSLMSLRMPISRSRSDRLFNSRIRFRCLRLFPLSTSHGIESWLVPSRVNIRARWTVRICTVCIETPIRTNRRKTASFGPGGRRGAKFSSQELSFRQLCWFFGTTTISNVEFEGNRTLCSKAYSTF